MIVATYNVHRCIGSDGKHAPWRIAEVLKELGADLVALQEVSAELQLEPGLDQFEFLARAARMKMIAGPTIVDGRGRYGNALLTRLEPKSVARIDLSVPGREPRGAIDAVVETDVGPLRVIATHLGLSSRERREQARQLARRLGDGPEESPVLVLGDLNSVSGSSLGPLRGWMGRLPRRRTYPARRPVLPLDRIWLRPAELLGELRAHRSPVARAASDHLPLRAELQLETSAQATHRTAAGRVASKNVGLEQDLSLGRCDGLAHRPEGPMAARVDFDGVSRGEGQHDRGGVEEATNANPSPFQPYRGGGEPARVRSPRPLRSSSFHASRYEGGGSADGIALAFSGGDHYPKQGDDTR